MTANVASARPRRRGLGWRALGACVLLFLYLPILMVFVHAFNSGRFLALWEGFSLAPFRDVFHDEEIQHSVVVSLQVAAGSALLATVFGTLAGVALAQAKSKIAVVLGGLLALALVTPEIVNAVALLPWYVFLGVDLHLGIFNHGVLRMVLAHGLFSVAVVAFIVRARMSSLDPAIEEAAADLYAPPHKRFLQLTVPLTAPAVFAGAMVAFTLSLDNVIISSFVSVQGSTPWPIYIWGSLRTGLTPQIAAMSFLIFLGLLVVLGAALMVMSRSGGARSGLAVFAGTSGTRDTDRTN